MCLFYAETLLLVNLQKCSPRHRKLTKVDTVGELINYTYTLYYYLYKKQRIRIVRKSVGTINISRNLFCL